MVRELNKLERTVLKGGWCSKQFVAGYKPKHYNGTYGAAWLYRVRVKPPFLDAVAQAIKTALAGR